jgi:hypothetical protein
VYHKKILRTKNRRSEHRPKRPTAFSDGCELLLNALHRFGTQNRVERFAFAIGQRQICQFAAGYSAQQIDEFGDRRGVLSKGSARKHHGAV